MSPIFPAAKDGGCRALSWGEPQSCGNVLLRQKTLLLIEVSHQVSAVRMAGVLGKRRHPTKGTSSNFSGKLIAHLKVLAGRALLTASSLRVFHCIILRARL